MSIGPEKLLFIAVVALLVLGPQRLPVLARSAGRMLGELRRLSGGLQNEMRDALAEPRQMFQDAMGDVDLGSVTDSVRGLLDPAETPVAASGNGAGGPAQREVTPNGQLRGEATSLPAPPDDPSLN